MRGLYFTEELGERSLVGFLAAVRLHLIARHPVVIVTLLTLIVIHVGHDTLQQCLS